MSQVNMRVFNDNQLARIVLFLVYMAGIFVISIQRIVIKSIIFYRYARLYRVRKRNLRAKMSRFHH